MITLVKMWKVRNFEKILHLFDIFTTVVVLEISIVLCVMYLLFGWWCFVFSLWDYLDFAVAMKYWNETSASPVVLFCYRCLSLVYWGYLRNRGSGAIANGKVMGVV